MLRWRRLSFLFLATVALGCGSPTGGSLKASTPSQAEKSLAATGSKASRPSQAEKSLADPAPSYSPLCKSQTEIPTSECHALEALYQATGGDNWNNNTDWLVTKTPCSWFGVRCISGHISKLLLKSNALSGSLPPEIGNLIGLKWLLLHNNQLSSLPPEIGNLTSLQVLWLYNNQLSSLPPEIGKLRGLRELSLSDNQLSRLPPEIGNLSKLKDLLLAFNQLSSLPPEIGNLIGLRTLWLWSNQLSSLPPEIGNLTSLEALYLQDNQITTPVPTTFNAANLPNLTEIDFCPQTGSMSADAATDAFLASIAGDDWIPGQSC